MAAPDEDYSEFRNRCADSGFFELNLKYAFRIPRTQAAAEFRAAFAKQFTNVLSEVERFCTAFKGAAIFIKISRELNWLPRTDELHQLLGLMKGHGQAGLILANSEKRNLPEFVQEGEEQILQNGVICGEYLFDGTIELISNLEESCQEYNIPVVASGGMISEEQILLAMRAGASAVQLCTTFDYNKPTFYKTLASALEARIYLHGISSFEEFRSRLPNVGIALIHSTPFTYFERFWSEETQREISEDIRTSERMDIMVLSGHTLLERWKDILTWRFRRNLGLRLFIPNPEGELYKAQQKSWGIREGSELEARQTRVRETIEQLKTLWNDTKEDRGKLVTQESPEKELEIYLHDQCPFYSCYVFDGKVYIGFYPFVWTEELASPALVFFGISLEYGRVHAELERVRIKVSQTRKSYTSAHNYRDI